jgi:proteasome lid subunit RPN8/RPN11
MSGDIGVRGSGENGQVLDVTAEALAAIYRHARETYPNECCGFLIGPRGGTACDEARPCENMQDALHEMDPERFPRTARHGYQLGAPDLLKLAKSQRGERPVRIVYHSHVDVGAYFSDEDQRAALCDGEPSYPVDYLVVDVQANHIGGARLFGWDADRRTYVERRSFSAPPSG